jgi:wyosine [tRNA(Phe)-imidazoG37] synthetase (radical SAM superfamily)
MVGCQKDQATNEWNKKLLQLIIRIIATVNPIIDMSKTSYIFGPVPSRRLGRSLGVDLVPAKTCSFDCIYCQAGRTTYKTIERKEWVPLDAVLAELKEKIANQPDYITLSGSGEPTLFSRIGELIQAIKDLTDIPVAIITNGSLLWQAEVRRELLQADLILPSLDAGSERVFQKINRPHPQITFARLLEGLIALRREYQGSYWLEVFVLKGLNTTAEELADIADCIGQIHSDRIQLNTVSRPPTEDTALAVDQDQLHRIADHFRELDLSPVVEIITGSTDHIQAAQFKGRSEDILTMLQRRPCTVMDIARGLGMHMNEVVKFVESLTMEGKIREKRVNSQIFYHIRS